MRIDKTKIEAACGKLKAYMRIIVGEDRRILVKFYSVKTGEFIRADEIERYLEVNHA